MPAATYALASDTLIGVVRAWVIATGRPAAGQADEEATPLAIVGGLVLWLLRLVLAPRSTLGGFRQLGPGGVPGGAGPKAAGRNGSHQVPGFRPPAPYI